MRRPLIHTIIFISGIFFFFGVGIFGRIQLQDTGTKGGFWHVFQLNTTYAEDGEEEDDWRWVQREKKTNEEVNKSIAPKPLAIPTQEPQPLTIEKTAPIIVKQLPETQNITVIASLIVPYKPINGLTYVIYRLPDNTYIIQDPDGRFIDHKYGDIETAKKAIDEEGIFEPLFAFTAPNGDTFTVLRNMNSNTYVYRKDDGKTIQTTYATKSDLIASLITENPYNPNKPYNTQVQNTISSNDIEYAQAIAIAEGNIQELLSEKNIHAVSIERPIVPADYQVSVQTLIEKKVVTVNTKSPQPSVQETTVAKTVTTKPIVKNVSPVVVNPAPAPVVTQAPTPPPAPVATKPIVNTTTRAS